MTTINRIITRYSYFAHIQFHKHSNTLWGANDRKFRWKPCKITCVILHEQTSLEIDVCRDEYLHWFLGWVLLLVGTFDREGVHVVGRLLRWRVGVIGMHVVRVISS